MYQNQLMNDRTNLIHSINLDEANQWRMNIRLLHFFKSPLNLKNTLKKKLMLGESTLTIVSPFNPSISKAPNIETMKDTSLSGTIEGLKERKKSLRYGKAIDWCAPEASPVLQKFLFIFLTKWRIKGAQKIFIVSICSWTFLRSSKCSQWKKRRSWNKKFCWWELKPKFIYLLEIEEQILRLCKEVSKKAIDLKTVIADVSPTFKNRVATGLLASVIFFINDSALCRHLRPGIVLTNHALNNYYSTPQKTYNKVNSLWLIWFDYTLIGPVGLGRISDDQLEGKK